MKQANSTFPAENIIAVVAVSGRVAVTPDEGLRAVLGPVGRVVEGPRVPDNLVEELRDLDWVRRRARPSVLERTARGVRDMRGVVGCVEVLAVPATVRGY